jgi:hypothetical protein
MVQFFVYFHMMAKGRPMIDYNNVKKLFYFVDVKNFPKIFLSNVVGWEMVFCMHKCVMDANVMEFIHLNVHPCI